METKPADSVPVEQLAQVFNSAYSTYPGGAVVNFTGGTLTAWFQRNLISLPHSYAFFHPDVEGGQENPVGYAFIAERDDRQGHCRLATFGIAKEAQGKRLGSKAIRHIVEDQKKRGIRVMELECVKQDVKTLGMYQRLGFEEVQELPEWEREAVPLESQDFEEDESLEECDVAEVDRLVREFGDENLPWQAYTVSASSSAEKGFKLGHAYCVISDPADQESDAITVVTVFVEREWRGKGEARRLVRAMLARFKGKKWETLGVFPRVYGDKLAKVAGAREVDMQQAQMRLELND